MANSKRDKHIGIRVSKKERDRLRAAAERDHRTTSDFVRLAALKKAERTEPSDPHAEASAAA